MRKGSVLRRREGGTIVGTRGRGQSGGRVRVLGVEEERRREGVVNLKFLK